MQVRVEFSRGLSYLCLMQPLNFPPVKFRFKNRENKSLIFDVIRKKFVQLTPEEWVRQHCIHFLLYGKNFPASHINVEREIRLHNTKKRYDIVVFYPDGRIRLIVECKAPSVLITQHTFDQIARYNLALDATYLMVTNGMDHYFASIDTENECYRFLETIPAYDKK